MGTKSACATSLPRYFISSVQSHTRIFLFPSVVDNLAMGIMPLADVNYHDDGLDDYSDDEHNEYRYYSEFNYYPLLYLAACCVGSIWATMLDYYYTVTQTPTTFIE